MKVDPGNAASAATADSFLTGYVAHGRASTELERLLSARGLEWSIQDGRLQVLPKRGTTAQVVSLSPDTGLVGSPEYGTPDKKGAASVLKVKALLQPQIKPGGKIRIDSANIHGVFFRVEEVEHRGDTAGGDWYSDAGATAVS
jgi:hypothetical protein